MIDVVFLGSGGMIPVNIEGVRSSVPVDVGNVKRYVVPPTLEDVTVTPTEQTQTISASAGYDGIGTVTVAAIPSNWGRISWNGRGIKVS